MKEVGIIICVPLTNELGHLLLRQRGRVLLRRWPRTSRDLRSKLLPPQMGNARGHLVRAPRPDPYRPLCYAIALLVLFNRWLSFPRFAGGRKRGTKESPKLPNRAPEIDGPYLVNRNP